MQGRVERSTACQEREVRQWDLQALLTGVLVIRRDATGYLEGWRPKDLHDLGMSRCACLPRQIWQQGLRMDASARVCAFSPPGILAMPVDRPPLLSRGLVAAPTRLGSSPSLSWRWDRVKGFWVSVFEFQGFGVQWLGFQGCRGSKASKTTHERCCEAQGMEAH